MRFDLETLWQVAVTLPFVQAMILAVSLCVSAIITMAILVSEVRLSALLALLAVTAITLSTRRSVLQAIRKVELWDNTVHITVDDYGITFSDSEEEMGSGLIPWSVFIAAREHSAYYELVTTKEGLSPILPKQYPLTPDQSKRLHALLKAHIALV